MVRHTSCTGRVYTCDKLLVIYLLGETSTGNGAVRPTHQMVYVPLQKEGVSPKGKRPHVIFGQDNKTRHAKKPVPGTVLTHRAKESHSRDSRLLVMSRFKIRRGVIGPPGGGGAQIEPNAPSERIHSIPELA